MRSKLGVREGVVSAAVFGVVLFILISVDPRVRDHASDLFGGGGGVNAWSGRAGELGSVMWAAARTQSMDNAPLLVFATVGAVLTLFMLKS
jgi:hypothetical protein